MVTAAASFLDHDSILDLNFVWKPFLNFRIKTFRTIKSWFRSVQQSSQLISVCHILVEAAGRNQAAPSALCLEIYFPGSLSSVGIFPTFSLQKVIMWQSFLPLHSKDPPSRSPLTVFSRQFRLL